MLRDKATKEGYRKIGFYAQIGKLKGLNKDIRNYDIEIIFAWEIEQA